MKSSALLFLALCAFTASGSGQSRPPLTVPTGRMVIACDSLVAPGAPFIASIQLLDTTMTLGGFNLRLEFDHNALVFDSATFGELMIDEWEYIAVRTGKITTGDSLATSSFIRIVAIADQQDPGNHHPSERSQYGPGQVVRFYFYATDDRDFRGLTLPLRFSWSKCDDNSFSDKSGHVLMIGRNVTDIGGNPAIAAGTKFAGPAPDCIKRRYNAPVQVFDFRNAAVRIGD